MQVLDIIVLVLVGIFALSGLFKGLINSLFGLIGSIAAIVGAYLLCASAVSFVSGLVQIGSVPLDQFLSQFFEQKLAAMNGAAGAENIFTSVPDGGYTVENISASLTVNGIPAIISNLIAPIVAPLLAETTVSLSVLLGGLFAKYLISAVCFIVLFIILSVVIGIVLKILKSIFKLPLLGAVNRLLGLLFGAIKGILVVWVIFFGISFIGVLATPVSDLLSGTTIAKFLYDNNVVTMLISNGMNIEDVIRSVLENAELQ